MQRMLSSLLTSITKYAGFGAIVGVAFFAVGVFVASAFTPVAPGTVPNPTFGPADGNVDMSLLGSVGIFTGNVTMPGTGIWNTTGKVGIGTVTPGAALHVQAISNALLVGTVTGNQRWVQFDQGDKSGITQIGLSSGDGGNHHAVIGYGGSTYPTTNLQNALILAQRYDGDIVFANNNGTERMRITSVGNIGIGTASPDKKLTVAGEIKIDSSPNEETTPALEVSKGTGGGDTPVFRVLGDRSPTEVEVFSVRRNGKVCINNDCKNAWPSGGSGAVAAPTSQWTTSGANVYYDTGNVGIGTTAPNKQLHVKTASGNAEIDLQSAASPLWAMYQDDTTDQLRFWNVDNRLTLTANGNVGIGTVNPTQKLDVAGIVQASAILSGSSTNLVQLGSHFGSGEKGVWMSYDNTPGKATIQAEEQGVGWKDLLLDPNGGNVGIGTVAPQRTLHVVGPVRLDGLPGTGSFLCINGSNDVVRQATPCQ